MQVKLFKKLSTYTDKSGEERTATNLFVECGDVLVPIEVKYFEDKETGDDKQFRTRKTLISAFAEELPNKNDKSAVNTAEKTK